MSDVPITKCLSRISPDVYLSVMGEIITAAGCKPDVATKALDLLDARLKAAGLMTTVKPGAGADWPA